MCSYSFWSLFLISRQRLSPDARTPRLIHFYIAFNWAFAFFTLKLSKFMRLRLNAWLIESFSTIFTWMGRASLRCYPRWAPMPTNDAINKLFKIKFTIVRVPHIICCVWCRDRFAFTFALRCVRLTAFVCVSIFLFSHIFFSPFFVSSSFRNRFVSAVAHLPNSKIGST